MASNHMGVDITPATLQDGSLLAALDPAFYVSEDDSDVVVTGADPVGPDGIPGVTLTTATTGGTLVAGTYKYRVAAVFATGVGELGPEVQIVVPSGTSTNTVTVTISQVPTGETGGFKVYGRTASAELHLGDIAHGSTVLVDTGSVTPTGALPTETDETEAGEFLNKNAPQPVDSGQQPVEGEKDNATPTQGGV